MKKIIIITVACMLFSCEDGFMGCDRPTPKAPYGIADDITRYSGNSGYSSISYIYYCRSGQYISVTYTQDDGCSPWQRTDYTSNGICK